MAHSQEIHVAAVTCKPSVSAHKALGLLAQGLSLSLYIFSTHRHEGITSLFVTHSMPPPLGSCVYRQRNAGTTYFSLEWGPKPQLLCSRLFLAPPNHTRSTPYPPGNGHPTIHLGVCWDHIT